MHSGERPIGAANGKKPNSMASCQPPPPVPRRLMPPAAKTAAKFHGFVRNPLPPVFRMTVNPANRLRWQG